MALFAKPTEIDAIFASSPSTFVVETSSTSSPPILDYTSSRSLSTTLLPTLSLVSLIDSYPFSVNACLEDESFEKNKPSPQEDAGCEDFLSEDEETKNVDELRRGFEIFPKILKTRGLVGAMHALCPLLCKARHEYQKKCKTPLKFSPDNVNELFNQLLRGGDTVVTEFIVSCSSYRYRVQSV